jgi:hypothetical protein
MGDCIRDVEHGPGAMVSLDITDRWAKPSKGKIPALSPDDAVVSTHFIVLEEFDKVGDLFRFRNSWGENWGDRGYGYIGRKDLEATWWECWKYFPESLASWESIKEAPESDEEITFLGRGIRLKVWKITDKNHSTVNWFELADSVKDERIAWASAI